VRGGLPGKYKLHTLNVNTGPDGDDYAASDLATVSVNPSVAAGLPLPTKFPPVEDFRTLPVAKQRTITFSEDTTSNTFFMDSGAGASQFNANRVDSTIQSGTVEEWTVNNATAEWHVFHIHQTDFQLLDVNGVPQDFIGHQDNVNVPYQTAGGPPGSVKILIDFRDPNIVGKFVYHCHILEHEDGGMMSIAEVVAPGIPAAALQSFARNLRSPDRNVIANTLAGFQSGNYCKTPLPAATPVNAFRIERLEARTDR
jgi:FtsP/CotA-like multicopper oxidase with cupredoxin domain